MTKKVMVTLMMATIKLQGIIESLSAMHLRLSNGNSSTPQMKRPGLLFRLYVLRMTHVRLFCLQSLVAISLHHVTETMW